MKKTDAAEDSPKKKRKKSWKKVWFLISISINTFQH